MTDFIDRVCTHGLMWCPTGCHDRIIYTPQSGGVELFHILSEGLANSDLSSFHTAVDPRSGKDGPDEAVEAAMLMLMDPRGEPDVRDTA